MTEQSIEDKAPKTAKPKVSSSFAQRELDKAEEQFTKFDEEVKGMTLDRLNATPKQESAPPEISQKQFGNMKVVFLKPKRTLFAVDPKTGLGQKFNEKFREEYNFKKECVYFTFENKEIQGESTSMWTRPYGGMPAEEWEVMTGVVLYAPRYLAEQIKRKYYHRLVMKDQVTERSGVGSMYGSMAADTTIQRLDAHPVSERKSIFMGASSF